MSLDFTPSSTRIYCTFRRVVVSRRDQREWSETKGSPRLERPSVGPEGKWKQCAEGT
jgi:hypothetical protein